MTNYRWTICAMLFFATTVNYLDRQVLSLTWDEFIKPEFHWDESHYGTITSVFSIVYAICMLFAGRFIDWMGTKKGYLWAIGVWSFGACLHAGCGIATEHYVGMNSAAELIAATGDVVVILATVSMYFFLAARCILALGEAGNFPAAIKVTAEYFPKKDPCLCDFDLQCRCFYWGFGRSYLYSLVGKSLGLGNGFYRDRCARFCLDGFVGIHVHDPGQEQTCE